MSLAPVRSANTKQSNAMIAVNNYFAGCAPGPVHAFQTMLKLS